MKTFTEFTGKEDPTVINPSFPTFEEATNEKPSSSCVSEKMKARINEMMEACMKEMKSCHEDDTDNTAENYMAEYKSCMEGCMEGLKECCDTCIKQG